LFFDEVLKAANRRFAMMSKGIYELRRKSSIGGRGKGGLELDIFEYNRGRQRDVRSLSGGESFQAALCLALGLSDIVQHSSGGIQLDAMFIDEGFASLDADSLNTAMKAIEDIAGSHRLVGLISHVGELERRIDKQIIVTKDADGSSVRLIT
jgi:exonuclease SbcC